MRVWYRATSGVDGALQSLAYTAVILTAPIWIVGLLAWGAYEWVTSPSSAEVARQNQQYAQRQAQQQAAEDERKAQARRAAQAAAQAAATVPWSAEMCTGAKARLHTLNGYVRLGMHNWESHAREAAELKAKLKSHQCV